MNLVLHNRPDIDCLVAGWLLCHTLSESDINIDFVPVGTKKPADDSRVWVDVGFEGPYDHHQLKGERISAALLVYRDRLSNIPEAELQKIQTLISLAEVQDTTGKSGSLLRGTEIEELLPLVGWVFSQKDVSDLDIFKSFSSMIENWLSGDQLPIPPLREDPIPSEEVIRENYKIEGTVAFQCTDKYIARAQESLVNLGCRVLVRQEKDLLTGGIWGLTLQLSEVEKSAEGIWRVKTPEVVADVSQLLPTLSSKEDEWFSPFPSMVARGTLKKKASKPSIWSMEELIKLASTIR